LSKLRKGSSSGATGLPVSYYKDSIASSAGQAANLLGWSLCGWEMGMKGLHIWGNPSTVNKEWKRASSRIKAKLIRHHKFPACQIVESQKFKELYELVIKQRYEYLDGYTNAIYLFAEYLKQNCLNINHIVKYVLTTAENLQEHQRRTIQETIAPVYDTYGCSEINGIAYECSICNNYHVIDPHVYLEYGDKIDDNGSHSLYITDLDNYSFPLIRYKNDDLGIPATDSVSQCNIPFSSIANVTGRQSDIIKLPGGGILSVPSFFGSMLLKNINGLKQYQIEKVEHDMIFVNLVITNEYSDKDRVIIHSALREYLAGKIRYKVRYVDRLEPSPTGKHKLVIDRTLIT
jgi:phenylacetate-CoA ligase